MNVEFSQALVLSLQQTQSFLVMCQAPCPKPAALGSATRQWMLYFPLLNGEWPRVLIIFPLQGFFRVPITTWPISISFDIVIKGRPPATRISSQEPWCWHGLRENKSKVPEDKTENPGLKEARTALFCLWALLTLSQAPHLSEAEGLGL